MAELAKCKVERVLLSYIYLHIYEKMSSFGERVSITSWHHIFRNFVQCNMSQSNLMKEDNETFSKGMNENIKQNIDDAKIICNQYNISG